MIILTPALILEREMKFKTASFFLPYSNWFMDVICIALCCILIKTNWLSGDIYDNNEQLDDIAIFHEGRASGYGFMVIAVCVFDMAWHPIVIVMPSSLWLIRLFGFYWKRIHKSEIILVIYSGDKSKKVVFTENIFLGINDGSLISIGQILNKENIQLSEHISSRFGVELRRGLLK